MVLFVVTWTVAYGFLPEGALAAANSARPDVISDTVASRLWTEWSTIAAVNLLPLLGIALLNLLLGYRYAALLVMPWVVYYAVLLGTNSFGVPLAAPMAPSLAVLGRAGPYELAAYLFAVAVPYPLTRISLPWRPADAAPRDLAWRPIVVGMTAAVVVIVLAAWREATMLLAG